MKTFFLSLLLVSPVAHAGTMDSGGGAGVICFNAKRQVVSAQLLDLYEGRRRGLDIPSSRADEKRQFLARADRLDAFADLLAPGVPADDIEHARRQYGPVGAREWLEKGARRLGRGQTIFTPGDLGLERALVIPRGCTIQAIGYVEEGKLLIASEYYDKLSNTDRAAFWMHEAVYKIVRSRGKLDPERGTADIRALVAGLFARNTGLRELIQLHEPFTRTFRTFHGETASFAMSSIPVYERNPRAKLLFVPEATEFERYESEARKDCAGCPAEKIREAAREEMRKDLVCLSPQMENDPSFPSGDLKVSKYVELDAFEDSTVNLEHTREWFQRLHGYTANGFEFLPICTAYPTTQLFLPMKGSLYFYEEKLGNGMRLELRHLIDSLPFGNPVPVVWLDFVRERSLNRKSDLGRPDAPHEAEARARYVPLP